MLKIYIAGRTSRVDQIKELYEKVEDLGYKITFRWVDSESEIKPPFRGEDNTKASEKAKKEIVASQEADVFVLFHDPGIRGAYLELGAFLSTAVNDSTKKVIVVGGAAEEHMFEAMDCFEFVESEKELLEKLNA